MQDLKKWQLLQAEDVSVSPHFPMEKRRYRLPNGQEIDDFYVTTIADSVHIVPITPEGKVIMIRMYKPGIDAIMVQFPAGRFEPKKHGDILTAAVQELEEETGIKAQPERLEYLGPVALMTTKASEKAHVYLLRDAEINSQQRLDDIEEIEVLTLSPAEVEAYIQQGKIWDAPALSDWYLAKNALSQRNPS